ncbi:YvrJ family protein [Fictibacillus nanhaiensis]|nr:YvrJ family protein [Fictibacillus nanhaiensis]
MNEEIWISLIGSLGFPIAVTVYLLIRMEKNIRHLEQIVDDLIEKI